MNILTEIKKTSDYIASMWEQAVITHEDNTGFFLPYSFVPPCATGRYKVLFYWDTFFTNEGLLADGKTELAKNNVDNLIYLLEKYGYVPNSNSESGIKWCSQPPYLVFMVKAVFEKTNDYDWLKRCCDALEKEYAYFMRERLSPVGLNRYGHEPNLTNEDLLYYFEYYREKFNLNSDLPITEKINIGRNLIAAGESGEDFTTRFGFEALDITPVDLNSLMYGFECTMAYFYEILGVGSESFYYDAAVRRKELMQKYCLNPEMNIYGDYNHVKKEVCKGFYATQFLPFAMGLSNDADKLKVLLEKLEFEYGIAATEKAMGQKVCQWSYPNTWAPHTYHALLAMKNCGMNNDLRRVANKYLKLISDNFNKTSRIWEKYDVNTGKPAYEYRVTEMLGWTAGVFQYIVKKLFALIDIDNLSNKRKNTILNEMRETDL